MDSDDITLMTTETMAIVLDDNGCCVRHPFIKLKDYDKNGDVYLKESCPECQSDFAKSQSLLLEKRRELDRKLQELGDDSPHDERHADFVQMVAPNVGSFEPGSPTPYLSPTLPTVRPAPHDMDALAAQMHHIQHMQDILTLQKDRELHELRDKLEALQLELTDKKIEIALLHERMSQQQMSYERELKLIQRAVALDKERRERQETSQGNNAKEIHIRSLNVQLGNDYADSSITKKVAATTLTKTLEDQGNKVFIADKTMAGEESTEPPKSSNLPVESNKVDSLKKAGSPSVESAATSNDSSNMDTIPSAYAVDENSDSGERPPHVSRFESAGELPVALGQLKSDDSISQEPIDEKYVIVESIKEAPGWTYGEPSYRSYGSTTEGESTYLSSTADDIPLTNHPYHRSLPEPIVGNNSDDDVDDEEGDTFDPDGPAPPVTVHHPGQKFTQVNVYKPGPLTTTHGQPTTPHGQPTNPNVHRKEPMEEPEEPLPPPKHGGSTGDSGFHPCSGATPVDDFEFNSNSPPMVPLDEQVTLPSLPSDRFIPRVVEDEDYTVAETTGPTVASSTYGENRYVVSNQTLLDPYGDKGVYSGVLLLSTNLPHGNGKMLYEDDGRTYDGDWRHGRWHGWGKATFSNGDRFEGFYKYDQRHGQGKYEWSDGRVYEGEFTDDKRCGKGHFIWPDGADYVGDFENGQRHGRGLYKFAHGAGQYDGEWVNGRYEGYGDCKWSDGRMYKGEWKAGMAHGRGTEWYPDGRIRHEGHWLEDEPVRDEYDA